MPKHNWSIDGGGIYLLSGMLLVGNGPLHSQEMSAMPMAQSVLRASLLEIHLNGENLHQTALLLTTQDGRMLAASNDLARWHLHVPDVAGINYQGQSYVPLDAIGALTYQVDAATQSLSIEASSSIFFPSTLDVESSPLLAAQMPAPGGFINYDLSAQRIHSGAGNNGDAHRDTIGAQLDLGIFGGGVLATTGLLNQDMISSKHLIRLDSSVTLDHPGQMTSLRLGDAVSRGAAWSRSLRFGGIQWSTNFATRPDVVTFPLPSLSGSAVLPSTAELFVNGALSYQHALPAGPFSIRQLPVTTGQGEVRLVVRDLLGREQVITQSYYAERNLLRPGLSDFSYELGALRHNFASASNDYRQWLLGATQRHGVSDRFTTEVHAELRPERQAIGLTAIILWPRAGVFDATFARSRGALGGGALLALGFQRQTPMLSFGLRTEFAGQRFEQAGSTVDATLAPAPLRQATLHAGWNTAQSGSFGLAYLRLAYPTQFDRPAVSEVISASYQRTMGSGWHAGFSAFRMRQSQGQGQSHYAFSLMLTHALDQRRTASISTGSNPGSALLQLQQNLPTGNGVDYRVLAASTAGGRVEARGSLQTDVGNYTLEAARQSGGNAYRASANGALAVLGGQAFVARRLGDSFAVVRVPGYPGVQVYAENQPVARTDHAGTALISRLRPYQQNRISIEQGDLPLTASVGALDIIAIPYYRSGYDLIFPVTQSNGALLRLTTDDGNAVPAGALVTIGAATFPVALGGQVYLTGLKPHNQAEVTWGRRRCTLALAYVASAHLDTPLPNLGTVICQPIPP
jgi:outer membrane usher protein